jgi:hypothetical protein
MEKELTLGQKVKVNSNTKSNEHYDQVKRIIDGWPPWKKEIHQKLVRLTT